jgi:hypothetical protein
MAVFTFEGRVRFVMVEYRTYALGDRQQLANILELEPSCRTINTIRGRNQCLEEE